MTDDLSQVPHDEDQNYSKLPSWLNNTPKLFFSTCGKELWQRGQEGEDASTHQTSDAVCGNNVCMLNCEQQCSFWERMGKHDLITIGAQILTVDTRLCCRVHRFVSSCPRLSNKYNLTHSRIRISKKYWTISIRVVCSLEATASHQLLIWNIYWVLSIVKLH